MIMVFVFIYRPTLMLYNHIVVCHAISFYVEVEVKVYITS